MRILHLDGGHEWAGGQNQVRLLMRELAKRGVEQVCACPHDSALAERLRAENLPVRAIRWSGGADPRAIVSVAGMARQFDVVHCHDAHALQIAWLPTRLARAKLVAARRVHFKTSAAKWNRADAVIAISGVVEKALLQSGVAAHRIHRIPSGIDVSEVSCLPPLVPSLRERLQLGADACLIASIGQLAEYKGQNIIPFAAARVPDAHWAIIGDGPLRASIEHSIRELQLEGRVHLTGRIEDARRVLRELQLFVFTSPDEPLGTSIFDALAADVPVIAANAAGAAEILAPVQAQTDLTLYPPGDVDALASLIARVKAGSHRAELLAAQRARLRDFTIENTAQKTLALYAELLGAQ